MPCCSTQIIWGGFTFFTHCATAVPSLSETKTYGRLIAKRAEVGEDWSILSLLLLTLIKSKLENGRTTNNEVGEVVGCSWGGTIIGRRGEETGRRGERKTEVGGRRGGDEEGKWWCRKGGGLRQKRGGTKRVGGKGGKKQNKKR